MHNNERNPAEMELLWKVSPTPKHLLNLTLKRLIKIGEVLLPNFPYVPPCDSVIETIPVPLRRSRPCSWRCYGCKLRQEKCKRETAEIQKINVENWETFYYKLRSSSRTQQREIASVKLLTSSTSSQSSWVDQRKEVFRHLSSRHLHIATVSSCETYFCDNVYMPEKSSLCWSPSWSSSLSSVQKVKFSRLNVSYNKVFALNEVIQAFRSQRSRPCFIRTICTQFVLGT